MEVNIREEILVALKTNKQKMIDLNRSVGRAFAETSRGEKPHHDLSKLMKMSLDAARLHMQLLEQLSEFPPPEVPRAKATREDWEIVKNAVLRGEEPVWL